MWYSDSILARLNQWPDLCELQNLSVVTLRESSAEADYTVLHIITARVHNIFLIPLSFKSSFFFFLIKKT